jgi:hypothetical protein
LGIKTVATADVSSCLPGRLTEIMVNEDSRFRSKDQKKTALLLFCFPSVSERKDISVQPSATNSQLIAWHLKSTP